MPNYDRLHDYLLNAPPHVTSMKLSFTELEQIVQGPLPSSARRYPAWWANDPSHSHAQRWLRAGWRVGHGEIPAEVVEFVRSPPGPALAVEQIRSSTRPAASGAIPETLASPAEAERDIVGYRFQLVGSLEVVRDDDGSVWSHAPQSRYEKAAASRLNRYGDGEFCEFRVRGLPHEEGVYALFVADELVYIGEAVDLHRRWYDYGHIAPRKCFEGGQETNCRLNKLVQRTAREGRPLGLWFCRAQRRKEVEAELRERFRPPWNAV